MEFQRRIGVTGGAGFIGSNLLLRMVPKFPTHLFVNIDCLTYAGNLGNLTAIEDAPNYQIERLNICDRDMLRACFDKYQFDSIIHLAAETHVDRSIAAPADFVATNVVGTFNLLEQARRLRDSGIAFRFHHVSTDEVFGAAEVGQKFTEESPYRPNSPYAASKAAADHLVRSFSTTYGLDTVTTNCSNNFGAYQFPEKLVPLVIRNARAELPLPVYGDGRHVRDWLYIDDHCTALELVFQRGQSGRTYNVSAGCSIENIELVRTICRLLDASLGGQPRERLISLVKDRPGHDRRYALDATRLRDELGWEPRYNLDEALRLTVEWYLTNEKWLNNCITGDYLRYYDKTYSGR